MLKTTFFSLLTIAIFAPQANISFYPSSGLYADSSVEGHEFFPRALENITAKNTQAITPIEKSIVLIELQSILTTLLKSDMPSEAYYNYLRNSEREVKEIFAQSEIIGKYLNHYREPKRLPFTLFGTPTVLYENLYAYKQIKTEVGEEREDRFAVEYANYKQNNLIKPIIGLTDESIKQLLIGTPYNFIVKADLEVCFAPNQDYDLNIPGVKGKRLVSPNHPVLANNQPVLSAGEFIIYRNGEKILFLISNSSGHYLPEVACLKHFEDLLVQAGIPREVILSSEVPLSKLALKALKKVLKEKPVQQANI